MIRTAGVAVVAVVLAVVAYPVRAADTVDVHPGESLRLALDRYRAAGLNVVSSNRLLPQRLVVTVQPPPDAELVTQVRLLLAPHELTLVMIDGQNGYVARAAADVPVPPQSEAAVPREDRPIEEIVVRADYHVGRGFFEPSTLARQDLQTLPSLGRDTFRGLGALPGIASSGVSARQRFRGGDDNEVLYRVDGVELIEPFHLSSVQSLFSSVNPNIVESADVYLSGFPVALGTRMSGVVDLELVQPEAAWEGTLDLNMLAASMDARGRRGSWSWLASGRRSLIDLSLERLDEDYGHPRFDDELLRVAWEGEKDTVVVGGLLINDVGDIRDPGGGERAEADYDHRSVWLRWTHDHSTSITSRWQLNLVDAETKRVGTLDQPLDAVGALTERRKFDIVTLANRWLWRPAEHTRLEAGWSFSHTKGDFVAGLVTRYGPVAIPVQGVAEKRRDVQLDRSGDSTTAFLSLTRTIVPSLTLTAGIRYDGQDIDPVHVKELSARLRANWQPTPEWLVFADLGRYTQQQRLHEIQIDDGKVELDPPQHADQVNLGAVWSPQDSIQLRLDMFHREIENPWSRFDNLYNRWVLVPELQGDRYEIAASRAHVRGVEAVIIAGLDRPITWQLSYVHGAAEERIDGRWHDRPWHQRHSFKAGLRWRNERWRLGVAGVYRTGWPVTPLVTTPDMLPLAVHSDRLPDYFSLDLHVARVFRSRSGMLECYLDISNLTNRDNVGGYDYGAGLDRDPQDLLPMLPTLGVAWRW